jgi:hypothetical protein
MRRLFKVVTTENGSRYIMLLIMDTLTALGTVSVLPGGRCYGYYPKIWPFL